jgi:Domain of unknown function (DUF4303)
MDPNTMTFDWLRITARIEAATRAAFSEMVDKHAAEGVYAFALYSDGGAMTVCPSTNSELHLTTVDQDDLLYMKFEPAEWKYEMLGADVMFNDICTSLREELDREEHDDDDAWFNEFQSTLFDTCVDVLDKLKTENFFHFTAGREVFLTFTVSDYEFTKAETKRTIIRLNDSPYRDEYLAWMKTWE